MPEPVLHICGCNRDKDGAWRFICACGAQVETDGHADDSCPVCGVKWEFEGAAVAA